MQSRSIARPLAAWLLSAGLVLGGCSSSGDDGGSGSGGATGRGGSGTGGARSGGSGAGGTGGGAGGSSAGAGGSSAQGGSPGTGGGGGAAGSGGGPAGGNSGAGGARTDGGGGSGGRGTDAGGDTRADGMPGAFTLSSSAFAPGGLIMRKYRCRYDDVSPPLSWTPGPPGTLSYAVTMRSAGSPHWALWDIPADTLSLPEKIERAAMPPVPAGSKQCKPNVDGSTWYGYAGACPMGGTNSRPYYFAVFALKVATLPGVTPDSTIAAVNRAIMANQIGTATLIGMAAPNSP